MLPNVSKIDFNSSAFHVDLWAVLQEPLFMTLRYHTRIANLENEHWPIVLLNFSMISILTLKSTLLLLLCGHPVSSPSLSVNYVICVSLVLFTNTATPQRKRGRNYSLLNILSKDLLCLNSRYSIYRNCFSYCQPLLHIWTFSVRFTYSYFTHCPYLFLLL